MTTARKPLPSTGTLLAAALAPIAAMLPLLGTVGGSWLPICAALAATMAAVSVALRLLRRPALASFAALLIAVGWLTAASAPSEAFLRVVPTTESVPQTLRVAAEGLVAVLFTPQAPIAGGDGVTLLALAAVAVVVLAVDLIVLTLRAPALAAVPMLAPIVLPMAYLVEVDPIRLAPAAIVYVALLVVGAQARGRRVVRRRVMATAALVALSATVVPAAVPPPREAGISFPSWFQSPGAGGSGTRDGSPPTLSTGISLGDDLRRGVAVDIFDYTPSDGQPLITRLTSLTDASAGGFVEQTGDFTADFSDLGGMGEGVPITTEFAFRSARVANVPIPEQALTTSNFNGPWRWDPTSQSIGFAETDRRVSIEGERYAVSSLRTVALPDDPTLQVDGQPGMLQVPEEAAFFRDLAPTLVDEDAPPRTRAAQLYAALTDDSWTYSEDVAFDGFGSGSGGEWGALESFMSDRAGYCVHYASSMAVLSRAAGIPARVAIGFLPGADPEGDGTYTVTTNDMHAWAELWFDGWGWVRFDTTPPVAAGGRVASAPGSETTGAASPSPTPSASPSVSPSASPSPSAVPAPTPSASADAGEDPAASGSAEIPPMLWWALGLLVAAVLPASVREVVRRLRLRRGAAGAWAEVHASVVDAGWRLSSAATPLEVERFVVARGLDAEAAHAVSRLRDAAERAAFDGQVAAALRDDVRTVRRGLFAALPAFEAAMRTIAPRSLLPTRRPR